MRKINKQWKRNNLTINSSIHYPQIHNLPFHLNILKHTWELKLDTICRLDKKLNSENRMHILIKLQQLLFAGFEHQILLLTTESCEHNKTVHLMRVNSLLGTIWNRSLLSIIKIANHHLLKYFSTKYAWSLKLLTMIKSRVTNHAQIYVFWHHCANEIIRKYDSCNLIVS